MHLNYQFIVLILVSSGLVLIHSQNKPGPDGVIKIKAVGRSARLGSLYNAVTEIFSQTSVFNQDVPPEYIRSTATPFTSTKYQIIRTYLDLAILLGISAELTLGLKLGGLNVGGSGRGGGAGAKPPAAGGKPPAGGPQGGKPPGGPGGKPPGGPGGKPPGGGPQGGKPPAGGPQGRPPGGPQGGRPPGGKPSRQQPPPPGPAKPPGPAPPPGPAKPPGPAPPPAGGGGGDVGGSIGGSVNLELRTSWNHLVGAISYETMTFEDILEIYFDGIKNYTSRYVMDKTTDTHIVIGIGWGAHILCKFEDNNVGGLAAGALTLNLNAALSQFMFSAGASTYLNASAEFMVQNYKFELTGDVDLYNSSYPSNSTMLVNFIRQIPQLVNRSNGGKGRALYYYLLPIEKFREFLEWEPEPEPEEPAPLPPLVLPAKAVADSLGLFEEIDIVQWKLNYVFRTLLTNRDTLPNRDLRKLLRLRREFNNQTELYKLRMAQAIVDIRLGLHPDPVWYVTKLINHCRNDDTGLERLENILDFDFRDQLAKIHFAELVRKQQVAWAGRENGVDVKFMYLLDKNGIRDITICLMRFHRIHLKNTGEFLKAVLHAKYTLRKDNRTVIVVADCDFPQKQCVGREPSLECEVLFDSDKYGPAQDYKDAKRLMMDDDSNIYSHSKFGGRIRAIKDERRLPGYLIN